MRRLLTTTAVLVPLLADIHHAEPLPLHAVYPHGRHRSPRVAAMIDFLLERFGDAPWRAPLRRKKRPAGAAARAG